jgi:hypothetical protein
MLDSARHAYADELPRQQPHSTHYLIPFPSFKEMLTRSQNLDTIPHPNLPVCQRRDLHPQARILAPLINDPVFSQRSQGFVHISYSRVWVDVGQFAARCATGEMVVCGCDFCFCPGVFCEGRWARDVDVCAVAEGVVEDEADLPDVFGGALC